LLFERSFASAGAAFLLFGTLAGSGAPFSGDPTMTKPHRTTKTRPAPKHHLDQRADMIIAQGVIDDDDDLLLTTPQCALWLGVSIQFLEIGRSHGYGPPFVTLAPRVIRYRKDEVNTWLRERSAANVQARRAKLGEG
jgi:hypothetical protein